MRRAVLIRNMALVVAGLAVVASCGSRTPAQKEPASVKTYTTAELRAAMPEVKDVPAATKLISKCPGSNACAEVEEGTAAWSYNIGLEDDGFVGFTVTEYDTLLGAQQDSINQREVFEKFDGAFETKPEKLDSGYSPGMKGAGSFEEFSPGDWDGFIAERIIVFTDLNDKSGDKTQDSFTLLRLGKATVSVVAMPSNPKLAPGVSNKLVKKLVADYLERLG